MIAGTLPSPGWRVSIFYPERRVPGHSTYFGGNGYLENEADVEDGAYYAVAISGHVVVRLSDKRDEYRYDFDAGTADCRDGLQVRNISTKELLEAMARPRPLIVETLSEGAVGALVAEEGRAGATYELWTIVPGSTKLAHASYDVDRRNYPFLVNDIGEVDEGTRGSETASVSRDGVPCGAFTVTWILAMLKLRTGLRQHLRQAVCFIRKKNLTHALRTWRTGPRARAERRRRRRQAIRCNQ
jgi:hypothetical protein